MQRGRHGLDSPRDGSSDWHVHCSARGVLEIQSMVIKELSTSAASHAITALAMRLARRGTSSGAARLTLCYLLPDEQGAAPFAGMRLASHDAERGVLTIEACVPTHLVTDTSRAGRYVLAVAADAIDAARDFFDEQGLGGFDAEELHAWVMTIQPKDLAPPAFQQVKNTDFDWS
jgi:hypothetical protein